MTFAADGTTTTTTTTTTRRLFAMALLLTAVAVSASSCDPSSSSQHSGPQPCPACPTASDGPVSTAPTDGVQDDTDGRTTTTVLETRILGTMGDEEGRGKKKKKTKNTSMNMMVGGSIMTAMVVILVFLNAITVTLGKAFLFTFITKFLVSVNWIPSGSSSKEKSPHQDITVLMQ